MTQAPQLTDTQRAALDAARTLARAGVPLFLARPDETSTIGFSLPSGWQHTTADPAVVDAWSPGMALCAVMGVAVDLLDVDPRNGGDVGRLAQVPRSYAVATTPSGGLHSFIAPLGVGSRDGVLPGVDVKGGRPDGSSRGFAFLAPTVKASKETGEPVAYAWHQYPAEDTLAGRDGDQTGAALAALVTMVKAGTGVTRVEGPAWWREFATQREPQSQAAAERAINGKLAEVSGWTAADGGFRAVLMRAAMTLGGYVGGGWLDEGDAWRRLETACSQAWGSPDEDDRRWIEQGLADGAEQPFAVYTPEDEATFGEAAQAVAAQRPAGPPWSVYRALGTETFDPAWCTNDQEYAEAVAVRTIPVLRFAQDTGTWVVRRAESWREREDLAGWAVALVGRLMPLGETPIPKDVTDRTEGHWQAHRRAVFLNSGTASRVERKLKAIVRADHPAAVELADLDGDPEVLWAGGYPFDLRASGDEPTLAPVDPSTPHMHTAAVAPLAIETPFWDRFVAAVWPDPAVRAYAMRVLGLALAGYPDAALPVLYGPERTGKTAAVSLIVRVLGSYAHSADPRLLAGADHTHASVVYALRGRRLSFIDEGPRRGHLAAERLKQLTGGGQLTGNAMRSNPITFNPTHTLVMTTNDEPPITDPALRARVRIVPCDADQAEVRAARQALTPARWEAEAPGVLAALMRECAGWLADPDSASTAAAPASISALAVEMAAGQDPVREWVELCTLPADPGTPGRELYRKFVGWFDAQPLYRRQTVPSESAFGRSLNDQGFPFSMGGPRKKIKYRPLSVMDGGAGPAPWEPQPPAGAAYPVATMPDATPPVASPNVGGGSSADTSPTLADTPSGEVSAPENTRSEPKFSSSADTADTSSRSITESQDTSPIWSSPLETHRGIGDDPPKCRQDGAEDGDNRRSEPVADTSGEVSASSGTTPAESPNGPVSGIVPGQDPSSVDDRPAWLVGRDLSQSVTNEEVSARVAESGLGRGDARKALNVELRAVRKVAKAAAKVAEREAAIRTAAGEVYALPCVVDRAGNVLDVTVEQAEAVVAAALRRTDGTLTVDVETTGYPVGHRLYGLRTVQLGDDAAAVVFDANEHAGPVRELLGRASRLHAHSASADLVPLDRAGLIERESGWDRMDDTVLRAKLADPQSTGSDPGLKRLAGNVLGAHAVIPAADQARSALFAAGKWSSPKMFADQLAQPIERNGWANVESGSATMVRYAASDVLDTAPLAGVMPEPPAGVLARERLAQRVTARVAHDGVRIDAEHVARLTEQHTAGKAEAGARVRAFGVENPGSDAQVGTVAEQLGARLPRTGTGRPSVAVGVLDPMRGAEGRLGEFVAAVLDYRHHDTALGLFLRPYSLLCSEGDGRARPTVYTIGTDTGRMSCVRPNMQQLPREGGVRACVTADPGEALISADFSGVELRVAAALSGDPQLRAIIAEEDAFDAEVRARAAADQTTDKVARAAILAERGWDNAGRADGLHWLIARLVWGPDATKAHRYMAKRIVFGRLYGGGLDTLAMQAGTDHTTAQRALDALDEITPGLTDWSRSIREAVKGGRTKFQTYSGRVIHLPAEFPHKAPNYCIQGTARELLVDALIRWEGTRWAGSRIIPVHDEIVTFVPEAEAAEATAALIECMTTTREGVRIVAEADEPSFAWQDSA